MKCKTRGCNNDFYQYNSLQTICPQCAIKRSKKATAEKEKQKRKENKEAKEKLKNRSDYIKEAQAAVNEYVRLRDHGKPCISCGRPFGGKHQRHAGHYRSVGACPQLRFYTLNIHSQCAQCNSSKSGNILEYRINLVKKLGHGKVEWIESQNYIRKYEIDYLKRLKTVFKKKTKLLKKRMVN